MAPLIYKARQNQPKGYVGANPRIYRCKDHDYVHYLHPWVDSGTGREYKAGYYDENGNYYEDVVFSRHGQVLDSATAVCRCDFCRSEDSRPWAEREKPCTHCGGTMTVISQVDEMEGDSGEWDVVKNRAAGEGGVKNKGCLIALLVCVGILVAPCLLAVPIGILGAILGWDLDEDSTYDASDSSAYVSEYELEDTMYLEGNGTSYTLTTQEEYRDSYEEGNYKRLVLDSDGNYYDKESDCYVYLNDYIDPPQFQYWYEGISSEYGDYGWMEYDEDEDAWYIEVEEDEWKRLSNTGFAVEESRLWHIEQ
ncbi:MAG: hypothetical protein IJT32_01460 [Lachnospiraceae bacterium]|nr:hypothetical protein [Lachnospiraceae bacterium]